MALESNLLHFNMTTQSVADYLSRINEKSENTLNMMVKNTSLVGNIPGDPDVTFKGCSVEGKLVDGLCVAGTGECPLSRRDLCSFNGTVEVELIVLQVAGDAEFAFRTDVGSLTGQRVVQIIPVTADVKTQWRTAGINLTL